MSEIPSLSRNDLYEKVWSTPMRKLASEFGLSDVGLAKICRKNGIPLPGIAGGFGGVPGPMLFLAVQNTFNGRIIITEHEGLSHYPASCWMKIDYVFSPKIRELDFGADRLRAFGHRTGDVIFPENVNSIFLRHIQSYLPERLYSGHIVTHVKDEKGNANCHAEG